MSRFALVLVLLPFTGCPQASEAPQPEPRDPAAERKAQVELETRMAEGGAALEVEAPAQGD